MQQTIYAKDLRPGDEVVTLEEERCVISKVEPHGTASVMITFKRPDGTEAWSSLLGLDPIAIGEQA